MKRILVIGTSGAGKSTLAQRLADRLGLPFFASDGFYWEPSWKIASPEHVHQQVMQVVGREAWVLDGNFDDQRELVWQRAEGIVWLDYSLLTIFTRVATRNLRWMLTRQLVWSGNRMSLSRAASGVRHAVKSHARKRQDYPHWLAEVAGIAIWRFRSSAEAEAWFQNIDPQVG